jgi:hypothetical protein
MALMFEYPFRRTIVVWVLPISAIVFSLVFAPCKARAQENKIELPPGAMTWNYECKAGAQCPTKCSAKGTELFQTSNYTSMTIVQIADQVFWFRVDTGKNMIEYVTKSEQVICSITGAGLKSAHAQESGRNPPPVRP